jgi:hypothetical protein
MFCFANTAREETVHTQTPAHNATPGAVLTLSQVLVLVERRLRWFGFSDWHIRDAVCLGQDVTVLVRGPCGELATFTVMRDGGAMTCAVTAAPALPKAVAPAPVRQAVVPSLARTLGRRAIGALWPHVGKTSGGKTSRSKTSRSKTEGRFRTLPVLCEVGLCEG